MVAQVPGVKHVTTTLLALLDAEFTTGQAVLVGLQGAGVFYCFIIVFHRGFLDYIFQKRAILALNAGYRN